MVGVSCGRGEGDFVKVVVVVEGGGAWVSSSSSDPVMVEVVSLATYSCRQC